MRRRARRASNAGVLAMRSSSRTRRMRRSSAAFEFQRGDVLVTTWSDYTSNQLMYLSLSRRLGIEVLPNTTVRRLAADPTRQAP